MLKRLLSVLFAATVWACGTTVAFAADDELHMGLLSLALSADPHAYINTGVRELSGHLYQNLHEKNPDDNKPYHVIKSSRRVGERGWEFHLFPGEINTNDLLFTFCRIKNYPGAGSPFATNIESISDVSLKGDTEISILTKEEEGQFLSRISPIPVLKAPPHWKGNYTGGRCDGQFAYDRADLDNGTVAPGTGPYRLEHFSEDKIVIVRREGKAVRKSPWRRVVQQRLSTEDAVRGLLAGTVDVIDSVPDGPAAHLATVSSAKTVHGYPSSFVFIQLNQRPTSPFVADGAANPLRDRRVRQAISLALDREVVAIRQRFDPGIPTGQISLPDSPLYNERMDLRADVDRARRLLTASGYPNGFSADFLSIPGAAWIADKIEPMVARVGIQIKTRDVGSRFPEVVANGEFGLNLNVAVVDQSDTMAFVRSRIASPGIAAGFGGRNQGQYKNAELDKIILKIRTESDAGKRAKLEREVMKIVAEDFAIIPLMFMRPRWHFRAGLDFTPRRDNRMLVWNISRKAENTR